MRSTVLSHATKAVATAIGHPTAALVTILAGVGIAGPIQAQALPEVDEVSWRARWGDFLVLDAHQRIQATVSTAPQAFGGSVAGFGVSAVPGRAVDLESVWIDNDRLRVWHDVDRLALSVYTAVADLTVGRQALSWGDALLFPVADLWSRFSPYELDTEEKPGVDAIRILAYPVPGLELGAVVADRGEQDDVSAGVRASLTLPTADLYLAGGRLWNEALVMAGITWVLQTTKLRAEAVLPRNLDRDRWEAPRATLGADWLGTRLALTTEYHFNGLGAGDPADYLDRLRSEAFGRGESYFLGRHHLGVLSLWSVDEAERIRLTGSLLLNVEERGLLSPRSSPGTWDVRSASAWVGYSPGGRSPSSAVRSPSSVASTAPTATWATAASRCTSEASRASRDRAAKRYPTKMRRRPTSSVT